MVFVFWGPYQETCQAQHICIQTASQAWIGIGACTVMKGSCEFLAQDLGFDCWVWVKNSSWGRLQSEIIYVSLDQYYVSRKVSNRIIAYDI